MKKTLSIVLIIILTIVLYTTVFSTSSAVDKIITNDDDFVILATIIGIDNGENIIELSKEYEISPKNTSLPSTIKVNKFKYSYCEEHSKSYNTPQIGDNIIVKIRISPEHFYVDNGAFKVDTVSHRTLKVFVPNEMKNKDCCADMLALAHYIRTDGAKTAYTINGNQVISSSDNKVINMYEDDYIAYYSNGSNSTSNYVTQSSVATNSVVFEVAIIFTLLILLVAGAVVIYIINKQ